MPVLVKTFIPGIEVVRGKDWDWDDQDGGEGSVGKMIGKSANEGWFMVKWKKTNYTSSYRIGKNDQYDLYFADDKDALLQEAMERFPSGCSYIAPNDDFLNENVEYEYPYFWRRDKSEIALKAGAGVIYRNGTWATRTDVESTLVQRVEVFPGIYVGDVVVSLSDMNHDRSVGDLFVVFPNSKKDWLYYKKNVFSSTPSYWRIATTKEIEFYNNGGRNINDMKPETDLTNDLFLIAEAIKRYPVGTKFYPVHIPVDPTEYCIVTEDSEFIISDYGSIYSAINGAYWMHQSNKKYGTTILNRKVYCKKNGWAQIVKEEKQANFNNQSNTNQNGNKTKEVKQSINSSISKSITREHNENTDNNNRQHEGRVIKVSRLSTKIGISTESRRVAVFGRRRSS